MTGFAVFDPVDMHGVLRRIGEIKPLDPCLRGAQQRRLAGDDHDGVHAADDLEFDHILTKAVLAGVHDLLQLGDDRLRIAVGNGENPDGLSVHPVRIKAQRGFHRGAPFGSGALNQKNVAAGISAYHSRL